MPCVPKRNCNSKFAGTRKIGALVSNAWPFFRFLINFTSFFSNYIKPVIYHIFIRDLEFQFFTANIIYELAV